MNRLALIALTGFLALALTACSEHPAPKQPTATDNTVQQPTPEQQKEQGH